MTMTKRRIERSNRTVVLLVHKHDVGRLRYATILNAADHRRVKSERQARVTINSYTAEGACIRLELRESNAKSTKDILK